MIEIYTGLNCAYCEAAKALLNRKCLDFTERNVAEDGVLSEFKARLPRVKSIPQIFIDGEHVGGLQDLEEQLAD